MKVCRFCAESIQDVAIVCRFCGRSLDTGQHVAPPMYRLTLKPPAPKPRRRTGAWLMVAALVLLVGFCSIGTTNAPTPIAASPTASAAPPLALLASKAILGEHHATVEGLVQNNSGEALRNVAVVITWLTRTGEFINSQDTLIDSNPILAGQTSPFRSLTSINPAMATYTVRFKKLLGDPIAHSDSSK